MYNNKLIIGNSGTAGWYMIYIHFMVIINYDILSWNLFWNEILEDILKSFFQYSLWIIIFLYLLLWN